MQTKTTKLSRTTQVVAPLNVKPTTKAKPSTPNLQTLIDNRDAQLKSQRENYELELNLSTERKLNYFKGAVNEHCFSPEQLFSGISQSNLLHGINLIDEMQECFTWAMQTIAAANENHTLDVGTINNVFKSHYQRFNLLAALLKQSI